MENKLKFIRTWNLAHPSNCRGNHGKTYFKDVDLSTQKKLMENFTNMELSLLEALVVA